MSVSPHRNVVAVMLTAASVFTAGRVVFVYLPERSEVDRLAEVARAESRANREAARTLLRMGEAGTLREIERLRGEGFRLAALVPPLRSERPEGASLHLRERLGSIAERHAVHTPEVAPLPRARTGGLGSEGYRVRAVGEYHALGTFLTELLSIDRLTHVADVRFTAVPDSLVPREGGRGAAQDAALPPGAAAGDGVVSFTVRWYFLEDAVSATDGHAHAPAPPRSRWVYPRGARPNPAAPPQVLREGRVVPELEVTALFFDRFRPERASATVRLGRPLLERRVIRGGSVVGPYTIRAITSEGVEARVTALGTMRQVFLPHRRHTDTSGTGARP